MPWHGNLRINVSRDVYKVNNTGVSIHKTNAFLWIIIVYLQKVKRITTYVSDSVRMHNTLYFQKFYVVQISSRFTIKLAIYKQVSRQGPSSSINNLLVRWSNGSRWYSKNKEQLYYQHPYIYQKPSRWRAVSVHEWISTHFATWSIRNYFHNPRILKPKYVTKTQTFCVKITNFDEENKWA